ncbi:MAG TPA: sigma-70 family RNA polymerase sigma factor [Gammaproteobacteria bacterium]|nr:sigma-70 family RNA polymerase sigma factor [Gammaproteobacteria bacterium]HIL18141.1 sigma-70 family RNA polymerase sigma factor [Gammaproteobacteria bacterium]
MCDSGQKALNDERCETFVQCLTQNEPDLRRFIRSLLPTRHDVEEVVQRTAIVAWRKFERFDPQTNFLKWAMVIARFEALAYRREIARDRLVFREDILELMAKEGEEELEERKAEQDALESCLEEIPAKQRRFITLAYTKGVNISALAEQSGATSAAFYMRLKRLRQKLVNCIDLKNAELKAAQ